MSTIVHLKWGEEPERDRLHLVVTRLGRVRGEDYFVRRGAGLDGLDEARSFASLASALRQAENLAQSCGAETIYVRMHG